MTRGERNNNPGNIDRNATKWQGMAPLQTDPRFVVFTDAVFGIRALACVLLSYYRKHDLKTVRSIINRWAPPVENNSDAYVDAVCRQCSVEPDDILNPETDSCLEMLVRAIIKHENGEVIYDDATIMRGVEMALA
jgi:hypothetical protein